MKMIVSDEIVALQDRCTRSWHVSPGAGNGASHPVADDDAADEIVAWLRAVELQHHANFELWHIEDEARRPGALDSEIAGVKRRIDKTNQRRNDLAEELDRVLLNWLEQRNLPSETAPLHSESPGLIIDRLSILALKIYHTSEEAERADGPEGHAKRNRERLAILKEQRSDLAGCLDALWRESLAGARRFKIYRQLKMYNDPSLNPAIYGRSQETKSL
jgi:hypothetical protein